MKQFFFVLFALLICTTITNADYLGIKQASEYISIPIYDPLDSAFGIPRKPDSAHIFTYADNATTKTFSARSTTYPFSDISIDTTKDYGDTLYWFVDQIQDIDGAGGNFLLAIDILMFYDKIPTYTHATVQVVSDSLNQRIMTVAEQDSLLSALKDANIGDKVWTDGSFTIRAQITQVRDTILLYDTRIDSLLAALADASINDKAWLDGTPAIRAQITQLRDSILLYDTRFDSLMAALADASIGDKVWDTDTTGHYNAGTYGYEATAAGSSPWDAAKRDSVLNALKDASIGDKVWDSDTTGHYNAGTYGYEATAAGSSPWDATKRDSVLNALKDISLNDKVWVDGSPAVRARITEIIDSLKLYDTRFDSLLAALTDASMGDKIWVDVAARTLTAFGFTLDSLDYDATFKHMLAIYSDSGGTTSGVWSTAQRDSALAALTDAAIFFKVWLDATYRTIDTNRTEQGGSAGGDGAYTRYVVVLDSGSADAPVADAPVFANNTAQTGTPYFCLTDNNGRATFQLDAADWSILMNKAGYQGVLDTITIAASGTDTIYTYTSSANKTAVYGDLYNALGQPFEYAEVRFYLKPVPAGSVLTFHDTTIVQTIVYDTANVNGHWEISVYSNKVLSDSSYYVIYFRDQYGTIIPRESNWNIYVSDTTEVNYNSLTKWRD